MIVYNVTIKVDDAIEMEWVKWMKDIHIPDVMSTACFTSYRVSLIDAVEGDQGGNAYSVQYTALNRGALSTYFNQYAVQLQKEHIERFGDKALAFRTIMEVLAEG